jgi:hypothetical protein
MQKSAVANRNDFRGTGRPERKVGRSGCKSNRLKKEEKNPQKEFAEKKIVASAKGRKKSCATNCSFCVISSLKNESFDVVFSRETILFSEAI